MPDPIKDNDQQIEHQPSQEQLDREEASHRKHIVDTWMSGIHLRDNASPKMMQTDLFALGEIRGCLSLLSLRIPLEGEQHEQISVWDAFVASVPEEKCKTISENIQAILKAPLQGDSTTILRQTHMIRRDDSVGTAFNDIKFTLNVHERDIYIRLVPPRLF